MPVPPLFCDDSPVSASLYETHVTVRCAGPDEARRLRRWAAAAGLKLTHMVLARGRMREQPMLTLSGDRSCAEASARARDAVARLVADGFHPVRVKTESTPWAPEVPLLPCEDERYFEHHVKLRLAADADLPALAARVLPHRAHLSWNARRVGAGGLHERFVTQRCRGVDAEGAELALQRLLTELAGCEVLSVEREFVLYDSDVTIDDGWIEETVAASGVRA
ncbi:hypothetical protein [Streptomyces hayashii]|uniref:hypothetical protein n=1 Tax=Streptomyces hayashii TaxID=2839966 RepID=UPI00403C4022